MAAKLVLAVSPTGLPAHLQHRELRLPPALLPAVLAAVLPEYLELSSHLDFHHRRSLVIVGSLFLTSERHTTKQKQGKRKYLISCVFPISSLNL